MKKHTTIIIILAAFAALLASVSCQRAETEYMSSESTDRVPVVLTLGVSPLEAGTPETKAVMEPDNAIPSDDQIANFVILQFDGVGPDAMLVGGQLYFDHWPLTDDDTVSLVGSESPNTIVVLANTFGTLTINNGITLEEFLADYTALAELSGIVTTSGGDDYLRMSGSVRLETVYAGSSVTVALKRNCAKVVVNVTNATASNSGDEVVSFTEVQLREINGKYRYLAHIGAGLDGLEFTDPYTPGADPRFDNPEEDFPEAYNTSGETQTYTYYVTPNLRGTTASTSQSSKGADAPEGATRFCIYASYGAAGKPVNYTYYLGGNLTNDFNLRPNYKYTYNITISAKGNAVNDYCVEDLGDEVVFATDANCYMVHPPQFAGQSRVYAFPVRRAATFWNEAGVNGGVYGASAAAGYEACAMDATTAWTAEILWSDFDMSAYMSGENKFLVVDSGTGFDPADPAHAQPYIKVKVSAGMAGNVVVAVKYGDTILWSWHIWITDYDPDVELTPVAGKYIYEATNGQLHRYAGAIWDTPSDAQTTGLAGGFIMDRQIGATSAGGTMSDADRGARNGLLYQFGRKDPFVGRNQRGTTNSFYLGGTLSASVTTTTSRLVNFWETGEVAYQNARYAVCHPMIYMKGDTDYWGRRWTYGEELIGGTDYTNERYLWHDKLTYQHLGNQAVLEQKKSVYDPCPPGWKVPPAGTFSGFSAINADNEESGTYTFANIDTYYTRAYYPEGYVNREHTGYILFYAYTYRGSASGTAASGSTLVIRMSNKASSGRSHGLYNSTSIHSTNSTYVYNDGGFGIRCVRE